MEEEYFDLWKADRHVDTVFQVCKIGTARERMPLFKNKGWG